MGDTQKIRVPALVVVGLILQTLLIVGGLDSRMDSKVEIHRENVKTAWTTHSKEHEDVLSDKDLSLILSKMNAIEKNQERIIERIDRQNERLLNGRP